MRSDQRRDRAWDVLPRWRAANRLAGTPPVTATAHATFRGSRGRRHPDDGIGMGVGFLESLDKAENRPARWVRSSLPRGPGVFRPRNGTPGPPRAIRPTRRLENTVFAWHRHPLRRRARTSCRAERTTRVVPSLPPTRRRSACAPRIRPRPAVPSPRLWSGPRFVNAAPWLSTGRRFSRAAGVVNPSPDIWCVRKATAAVPVSTVAPHGDPRPAAEARCPRSSRGGALPRALVSQEQEAKEASSGPGADEVLVGLLGSLVDPLSVRGGVPCRRCPAAVGASLTGATARQRPHGLAGISRPSAATACGANPFASSELTRA